MKRIRLPSPLTLHRTTPPRARLPHRSLPLHTTRPPPLPPPSPLQRLLLRQTRPYTSPPPPPPLSLSARLRKLSREYGWSALGVYLLLSAVDFPFSFLAVRMLGTERIGRWEGAVVSAVKGVVPWGAGVEEELDGEREELGYGHGVEEAEIRNLGEEASIWTQLALAYAIHKSFIFIRVPLTAAVTPKVVRVLRGWGWDIGKRKGKVGAGAAKGGEGG